MTKIENYLKTFFFHRFYFRRFWNDSLIYLFLFQIKFFPACYVTILTFARSKSKRESWNSSGFNYSSSTTLYPSLHFQRLHLCFLCGFLVARRTQSRSSRGWLSRQFAFRYFVSRSNEDDRKSSVIRWSTSLITRRIFFSTSLPCCLTSRHAFCSCRVGYQLAEIPRNHLRDRAAKCSSLGRPLIEVMAKQFR